jgi:hypothetical protein
LRGLFNKFTGFAIDKIMALNLIRKAGIVAYQAMEGIDRLTQLDETTKLYVSEFENHGSIS